MLNVLILFALVSTNTMNSTVDIGVAKQIEYAENTISETLTQGLFDSAIDIVGEQLIELDEVYETFMTFAHDYGLLEQKGFQNIINDINVKRNSNYDFAYLNDTNTPLITTFAGPRPGKDFEYGGDEGGGGTPTIPTPISEQQITNQYGQKKSFLNGKIDGKIFIGFSANAATCVSMYNSLLQTAGIAAVGGPTAMALIIAFLKAETLVAAVAGITPLFSSILQPILAFLSSIPAGSVIALILLACAAIALFIIIGIVYAGYRGKGFRTGLLRLGAFNYKYITELWD